MSLQPGTSLALIPPSTQSVPQFPHLNQLFQTLLFPSISTTTSLAPAQVQMEALHGGATFAPRTISQPQAQACRALSSVFSTTCPYDPQTRLVLPPRTGNWSHVWEIISRLPDFQRWSVMKPTVIRLMCPGHCI